MTIEIIIDGTKKIVTGQQLFDLAAQGEIGPETPVYVDGKKVPAGQAKGIIFGQRRNNAQTTSRDIPASHTTSADTNDQPSEGKEELPSDLRFILQAVGLGLIPLLALACFQVAGVVMP